MNDPAAAVAWLEDRFERYATARVEYQQATREMTQWRRANPKRAFTESPMWLKRLDALRRVQQLRPFDDVNRPVFEFISPEQDLSGRALASWPVPQWDDDLDYGEED